MDLTGGESCAQFLNRQILHFSILCEGVSTRHDDESARHQIKTSTDDTELGAWRREGLNHRYELKGFKYRNGVY